MLPLGTCLNFVSFRFFVTSSKPVDRNPTLALIISVLKSALGLEAFVGAPLSGTTWFNVFGGVDGKT